MKLYRDYLCVMNNKIKNNKLRNAKQKDNIVNESKKYGLSLHSLLLVLEDDDMMDKDNNDVKLSKMVVRKLCSKLRYNDMNCLEYCE